MSSLVSPSSVSKLQLPIVLNSLRKRPVNEDGSVETDEALRDPSGRTVQLLASHALMPEMVMHMGEKPDSAQTSQSGFERDVHRDNL